MISYVLETLKHEDKSGEDDVDGEHRSQHDQFSDGGIARAGSRGDAFADEPRRGDAVVPKSLKKRKLNTFG